MAGSLNIPLTHLEARLGELPSGRPLVSTSGGHGDARPLVANQAPVTQLNLADGVDEIRRVVRTEVSRGSQGIKFCATGGFASPADDPAQVPYRAEEIEVLVATAHDLGVLAVGKVADVVAMPGDPFRDITATERVDFVIKGGVIHKDSR